MAAMNMNQEQFKQLIREEKPVLVDFWAPWCGYCRRIGPAYEKIGEEYADSLAVGKINIDEEPQLAGAEGIKVIPTLVLFRNGKAVGSITAPGSKAGRCNSQAGTHCNGDHWSSAAHRRPRLLLQRRAVRRFFRW